jgi:plastocyanin
MMYPKICLLVVLLASIGVGIPADARAHGPTIEISHDALSPSLLNLYVGTTVHFSNTVEMPGGHVVVIKVINVTGAVEVDEVDEAESIESPGLEKPGDGWHYTFDEEGTFDLHIKQHPTAKARIVVVPKR